MATLLNGKTIYTAADAAEFLGIEASVVRRYCKNNRLPARKVAGVWLIQKRDLLRFAKQPREVGNPNFRRS